MFCTEYITSIITTITTTVHAKQVAAILRNLARGGRTVVCCTDKPCQRVLACMSELLLLSAGLLVYSGPADAAAKHFANIGAPFFLFFLLFYIHSIHIILYPFYIQPCYYGGGDRF